MPNQHAPDKEVLGFYIPRTLARRVRVAAARRGLTVTAFVELALTQATHETELSPEDYQAIALATKRARNRAPSKRARAKGAA